MTTQSREEIRGITLPMIRTFVCCTLAIITAVIGTGVYVKSTFTDHERRIVELENNKREIIAPMYTDVIRLKAWREEVTAYYIPKPKQP